MFIIILIPNGKIIKAKIKAIKPPTKLELSLIICPHMHSSPIEYNKNEMNEKKRAKPINIIFKIIENTFFKMFTALNNLDRI